MTEYRQILPSVPSPLVTELATVAPAVKLTEDETGRRFPQGYTVTNPANCGSVTVTFRETVDASTFTPPRPATFNCRTSGG